MEIGHILKNARTRASITQEQAAEAIGVSRQTISNWENGKTFPDIVSVIKMSDVYSVSLDQLLKEESPMKQTYLEYLKESTDTVKSNEKKEKLILSCVTFGVWALAVIAFWLVKDSMGAAGYALSVAWGILPILFFSASCILGMRGYYGRWKWLAAVLFSVMYALSGSVSTVATEDALYRSVVWPDLAKLPIGLIISLTGLGIGHLIRKKQQKAETVSSEKE